MTLNQVIKEQTKLAKLRNKLERELFLKKTLPALEKLIGKTFVYRRTCYSMAEKPSDYWDTFRKILRVVINDGAAWLVYEEALVDAHGAATIKTDTDYVNNRVGFGAGWEPCESSEYESNRNGVMDAFLDPARLCEYLEAR